MTDASLRTLERAWRASPTVEAEADYLRARVRAGGLAPERLELAAYVGHAAARKAAGHGCCPRHQALGRDPQEGALARLLCSESPLAVHDPLPAWIRGLERWGAPVQVRAALAAAWVAWAEWKSSRHCLCMGSNINPPWRECTNCGGTGDHDPRPRYALRAADAWLACPCERHRREWYERQVDTVEAMGTGIWIPNPDDEPHILAQRPLKAAERASPEAVRAAIRAELGRWALA